MLTTYSIRSESATAPPLVLLSAFPLPSAMWAATLKALAELAPERDYHTVEFPGFGAESSSEIPLQWTMESFAQDLKRMLDTLGIRRAAFAGISMGGYAALAFYRAFPERTAALILSNTQAAADTEAAKKGREEFANDVAVRGNIAAKERMMPKFLVPAIAIEQPDLEAKLEFWIHDADPTAIIAALNAMAARPDSTDLLPRIMQPTLTIAGSEDAFFSAAQVEAWAKQIPNSAFEILEGAGHLSPLDKPHEWSRTVAVFLQSKVMS